MNRDQFKKCIGQTLRLQPHAIGAQGEWRDDDWILKLNADEDEVVLKHIGMARAWWSVSTTSTAT